MRTGPKGWTYVLQSSYAGGHIRPDKIVCTHAYTGSKFTMIRTPTVMMEYTEPSGPVSQLEWNNIKNYCEYRLLKEIERKR